MENLETISLVCTLGVVICGLTLIVAATIRVIRDILKTGVPLSGSELKLQAANSLIRKRRTRNQGGKCPHCHGDTSDAQIVGSETTDEKTVLTKECPSCRKEFKVDA